MEKSARHFSHGVDFSVFQTRKAKKATHVKLNCRYQEGGQLQNTSTESRFLFAVPPFDHGTT